MLRSVPRKGFFSSMAAGLCFAVPFPGESRRIPANRSSPVPSDPVPFGKSPIRGIFLLLRKSSPISRNNGNFSFRSCGARRKIRKNAGRYPVFPDGRSVVQPVCSYPIQSFHFKNKAIRPNPPQGGDGTPRIFPGKKAGLPLKRGSPAFFVCFELSSSLFRRPASSSESTRRHSPIAMPIPQSRVDDEGDENDTPTSFATSSG